MTAEELCESHGIPIYYFEGNDIDKEGIYNPYYNAIAINSNLDGIKKKKVIYHEFGHKDHTINFYNIHREKAEAQANRKMIRCLLEEYLPQLEDISEFNYIQFMEFAELTTNAEEAIILEELRKLVGN
ncbi:ImmA/IrrE family metallo-endopeptidase [Streptococcus uberis]|uniref:ImmA/IrrE family metallo-endopeptidase n=1 Tax=Streptococcus uberis TaxID=1349 RepID=UPI001939C4BA|nr:ImmA/IrrE family metallo-endopeptidase [Streptococcus uberis]MCK1228472.1 ImmA/IrrE family metallo-endopeptidase [Streptococcus uberis]